MLSSVKYLYLGYDAPSNMKEDSASVGSNLSESDSFARIDKLSQESLCTHVHFRHLLTPVKQNLNANNKIDYERADRQRDPSP